MGMHLKSEEPSSFLPTCFGRKPTLEMCSKLMSDPKVPSDHEIIPKCQRVVYKNAFATTMTIIVPLLVGIMIMLFAVRRIMQIIQRRKQIEREIARVDASNKMQDFIDVLEVGKNDPPPIYADVVAVIRK